MKEFAFRNIAAHVQEKWRMFKRNHLQVTLAVTAFRQCKLSQNCPALARHDIAPFIKGCGRRRKAHLITLAINITTLSQYKVMPNSWQKVKQYFTFYMHLNLVCLLTLTKEYRCILLLGLIIALDPRISSSTSTGTEKVWTHSAQV